MMILAGRLVILSWAALITYVGYLLLVGEIGVIQSALEANRSLDVALHVVFATLSGVGVAITVGLFLFVGVLNEGSR